MTFGRWWVIVIAILAALAFLWFARRSDRRSRAAALDYSSLPFLEDALGRAFPWAAVFAACWAIAIFAFGVAFARPSAVASLPVHDASVVLCIDTSGSMASTDVAPSRSEAAHAAAESFIAGVPDGTRVAIVSFSTNAIPLGALTDDRNAAHDELDQVPGPNGGTAIGDALAAAARLLPGSGRRAIVLMTDGVNNHGIDPLEAAADIGRSGIAIFTVGIGTNGSGTLIPGTAEDAELDEDSLRQIARSGNGSYARAADANTLREKLGALAQQTVLERKRIDLALPAALGGGLLAVAAALGALFVGRFP